MTVSVKAIDALLPQTQCGECGFKGCMPYAEALARGSAPINKCPPGGIETMHALAHLLQVDVQSILEKDFKSRSPATAIIEEAECIGCTKCIQACPVDAIMGSSKSMHTILQQECTGCGLCIEPCPVDCIELLPLEKPQYDPTLARQRFEAKQVRALRDAQKPRPKIIEEESKKAKQAYILEALARAKSKSKPNE